MITVTIGGVTIGLYLLLAHAIDWYPGLEQLKNRPLDYAADWLPFLFAWAYGALGVLVSMGLIGWAFDTALWASNWLGDAALWLGAGQAPGAPAGAVYQPLGTLGSAFMVLITLLMPTLIKRTKSGPAIKRGMWCGLCLGTSSTIGGLTAVPLAVGANWVGDTLYGAIA